MSSLRIAVLQSLPQFAHVAANVAKARDLCAKLAPRSVDLVCLPEMAFTGYVFPSAASIAPYLEAPRTGPTSLFCAELAQRLQCYVAAGYPERLEPHEVSSGLDYDGNPVDLIGANSAVIYGPTGEWVGGYRKTNLFETDMTWAIPGTGYATFTLPPPLGTVSLGICMDLNPMPPAPWTGVGGPCELAEHALSTRSNLLILLNAWLDSGSEPRKKCDWHTLNYWAGRLRPLWVKPNDDVDASDHATSEMDEKPRLPDDVTKEMVVVVCNRSGRENGKTFAGTSAIFHMMYGSGFPHLVHSMGRREESLRVWAV